MKNILTYLCCILLTSCGTANIADICECYSASSIENMDAKLDSCLKDNAKANTDEEAEFKIKSITKSLVENCTEYRTDFNRLSFYRFETGRPELVSQKDSILQCLENNIESAKNFNNLAEIYIRLNNLELAMQNINLSIDLKPDVTHSHWVKSYIYQKKNDLPNAIMEMQQAYNFAEDEDSKFFTELLVLALKQK